MTYPEDDERIRRKSEPYTDEADDSTFRADQRAIIDRILNCREKFTGHEWGVAHLYYNSGLSEGAIAWIFGCTQQAVSRTLQRARRKALS